MTNSKAKEAHDDAVVMAAQHHSDLNIFSAVKAMLEGGTIYTQAGYVGARRVGRLCDKELQKQLKLYDAALRKAGVK